MSKKSPENHGKPLSDQIIEKKLKEILKGKYGYRTTNIISEEDFNKIGKFKKNETPDPNKPFFEIIYECKPKQNTVSSKETKDTMKDIQQNHYSLLVHFNHKCYYFDSSYTKESPISIYVEGKCENSSIMKTTLQKDTYTCATYMLEFIEQIVDKYKHNIGIHNTVNINEFEKYLDTEVNSNGDFMLLAQSGEDLIKFYDRKNEEYKHIMGEIAEIQIQIVEEEVENLFNGMFEKQNCEKYNFKKIEKIIPKKYNFKEIEEIIPKIIEKVNNIINSQEKNDEEKIKATVVLRISQEIEEKIIKHGEIIKDINNLKCKQQELRDTFKKLKNVCTKLNKETPTEKKQKLLKILDNVTVELDQYTIKDKHKQLEKL